MAAEAIEPPQRQSYLSVNLPVFTFSVIDNQFAWASEEYSTALKFKTRSHDGTPSWLDWLLGRHGELAGIVDGAYNNVQLVDMIYRNEKYLGKIFHFVW